MYILPPLRINRRRLEALYYCNNIIFINILKTTNQLKLILIRSTSLVLSHKIHAFYLFKVDNSVHFNVATFKVTCRSYNEKVRAIIRSA